MKTPEELAIRYSDLREFLDRRLDYKAKMLLEQGFLAGYKAAQDQLADADTVMSQWISVRDRLPEINEEVIVALPFVFEDEDGPTNYKACRITTARLVPDSEGAKWSIHTENGWITKVTHWMPLPAPPKEEK